MNESVEGNSEINAKIRKVFKAVLSGSNANTGFSTPGRNRTGTPERTGFWIQRVYQFRHRGILSTFRVAKIQTK